MRSDDKEFLVELLESQSREALATAKRMRTLAAKQASRKEAEVYLQQAYFEEKKAAGYLKQARTLRRG